MFEKQLQKMGLTEGESKAYEALVGLGPSTVGPIVKRTGIAYSKIYEVLQRLVEKGVVTYITREKTKVFTAVEPSRLSEYLDKQESEIQKSKRILERILPSLEQLEKEGGERTDAQIYLGTKGLMTAYERLLQNCTEKDRGMFFYVHNEEYLDIAFRFYKRQWKYLNMSGTKWKGITSKRYKETDLAKQSPSFMTERYVDFPIPGNIDIIRNKVLIVTWSQKPVGILIHSKELASTFSEYFEAVWKIAEE